MSGRPSRYWVLCLALVPACSTILGTTYDGVDSPAADASGEATIDTSVPPVDAAGESAADVGAEVDATDAAPPVDGATSDAMTDAASDATADAASDAMTDAPSDAMTDAPSDAMADATTNPGELLLNSNFTDGCASWDTSEVVLSQNATTFRSAPKSCRVCGIGATNPWAIYQPLAVKKDVGRVYNFQAYVRTDPSDAANKMAINAACELKVLGAGGAELQQAQGGTLTLNATWQLCSVSMTLNTQAAANGATITAIVNGLPNSRCFVVDDASLTTQP